MSWFRTILIATVCGSWAMAWPAFADAPLSTPKGEVVLTVSGDIEVTNTENAAEFDLEMLRSLEPRTITTSTIWTTGKQEFKGVSLSALVAALGAEGQAIEATALNDYMIEIPASDLSEDGPIIAYENNGSPMSIRDKGPLWIIYPYDDSPVFQSEVIYARSIWQLDRITVLE